MLKSFSAALIAVSMLAAPAFAGGQAHRTSAPAVVKTTVLDAHARMGRHHGRFTRHLHSFRGHRHGGVVHLGKRHAANAVIKHVGRRG